MITLQRSGKRFRTDLCQSGSGYRKSTDFLAWLFDLSDLEVRCTGGIRGFCTRTGLRHQLAWGKNDAGVFRAKLAEVYPASLCRAYARALVSCLASSKADSFLFHAARP